MGHMNPSLFNQIQLKFCKYDVCDGLLIPQYTPDVTTMSQPTSALNTNGNMSLELSIHHI